MVWSRAWKTVCIALSLVGLPRPDATRMEHPSIHRNQQSASSHTLGPITVPLVDWHPAKGDRTELSLSSLRWIVVDPRYAASQDWSGETLIPPTLSDFAETFARDLHTAHGVVLHVRTTLDGSILATDLLDEGVVYFTLGNDTAFVDAAGHFTAEAYKLDIKKGKHGPLVEITGASPLGAWWATRTLLQLAQANGMDRDWSIPVGYTIDSPGWSTRGMMLDAGRKFYPADYIKELCAMMSYMKQNTLHLHLSDNMGSLSMGDQATTDALYKAFRLRSDDPRVKGLAWPINETYSRDEYDSIQRVCASRGVTIVTELESPGHALPITRWKPQLAIGTDRSMLNISHPETIPTLKTVWDVFAPWLYSKTVSLGADEYAHDRIPEYNWFVKELTEHLSNLSKTSRIWATFPPRDEYGRNNTPKSVSIQHWAWFEADPLRDYIHKGYSVLNSDTSMYVVNKWSEWFLPFMDLDTIFRGNPEGGSFHPALFDTRNASNNPPRSEPLVQGHIAALWNDYGPNGTVVSETSWAWQDIPALADKQWGSNITRDQYERVKEDLWRYAPGQNLRHHVHSTTSLVLKYDGLNDVSGNKYHAANYGCRENEGSLSFDGSCWVETPLEAKGRDYTLSFEVFPAQEGGELFSNRDSALVNDGRVTMMADGNAYPLGLSLPLNTWTQLQLIARGNETSLRVRTEHSNWGTHRFQVVLHTTGGKTAFAPMAFPAPLRSIGRGFVGRMRGISLEDEAVE